MEYKERDFILAPLVNNIPDATAAALNIIDGLSYASYHPQVIDKEENRIFAMSAAGMSLSELILSQLRQGDFRHTIVAGTKGITLFVVLGNQYVLALCLRKITTYDQLLAELEPLLKPICDYLSVPKVQFLRMTIFIRWQFIPH
jgi:predicted regulator of Ras-like GTPase activity (Roadblock/LC7/MglB family)